MTFEIRYPIYRFIAEGYWERMVSYDRQTSLYLLKHDEKLVELVDTKDLDRIVRILQNKEN